MGTSRGAEALALLGLAQRAGAVVKGTDATRRALRKGEVRLVIVARDVSEAQVKKVVPLAEHRDVPWERDGSRAELGRAVGEGPLSFVGILEPGFAQLIRERFCRS